MRPLDIFGIAGSWTRPSWLRSERQAITQFRALQRVFRKKIAHSFRSEDKLGSGLSNEIWCCRYSPYITPLGDGPNETLLIVGRCAWTIVGGPERMGTRMDS